MPNANLLVPGTGGITFIGNDGRDVGYPVKMALGVASQGLLGRPADELVSLLSMEHRPGQTAPAKTSLVPGFSLRPGHVLRVAYNQVPGSWNHFLYDWRADMRHSAQKLLDFLCERQPAGGRWNAVGHSQGGLLIVLASKMTRSPDEFARHVASVVLIGTPLAGTINAARALILGEQLGEAAAPQFQRIVRTWPAIYQMMPAWPAVTDDAGYPVPDEHQMTHFGGWSAYEHISGDLIDRTQLVQQMLADPVGWMMGDVEVNVLMSRNRHTRVRVLRRNHGSLDPDSLRKQMGDSLVPHDVTLRWVGASLGRFVKTFTGRVNEHSRLLNDPGVLPQIVSLLRS